MPPITISFNFNPYNGDDLLQVLLRQARDSPDLHTALSVRMAITTVIPNFRDRLRDLAYKTFARYERTGEIAMLEDAIDAFSELASHQEHIARGYTLSNLGECLTRYSNIKGDLQCLRQAISVHREAVEHLQGQVSCALALHNLGVALCNLYQIAQETAALDEGIQLHREAADIWRTEDPSEAIITLNHLGKALVAHYNCYSDAASLDEAISTHRMVLSDCGMSHSERMTFLNDLCDALRRSWEQRLDESILEEAVVLQREALRICPDLSSARKNILAGLGTLLSLSAQHHKNLVLMDESVDVLHLALSLCSLGHPDHRSVVTRLGHALRLRFDLTQDLEPLDEAIAIFREAVSETDTSRASRVYPDLLHNLGTLLVIRGEFCSSVAEIEEAISLHRRARTLLEPNHPDHASSVQHIGTALHAFFNHTGDRSALADAIKCHREVLALRQTGHRKRSSALTSLGDALLQDYDTFRREGSLCEAITKYREVLELCSSHDSQRLKALVALGEALFLEYKLKGTSSVLDKAISHFREAQRLRRCYNGDSLGQGCAIQLARGLTGHSLRHRDLNSLNEATAIYNGILASSPPASSHYLQALAELPEALSLRFRLTGEKAALNEAIVRARERLSLEPEGDPGHFSALHDLSGVLHQSHAASEDPAALDEAISLLRKLVVYEGPEHPSHGLTVQNLAEYVFNKFMSCREMPLLDECRRLFLLAEQELRGRSKDYHYVLFRLSDVYATRDTPHYDLEAASKYLLEAVACDSGSARSRLGYGCHKVYDIETLASLDGCLALVDGVLLSIYKELLGLLPRVAALGLDLTRRLSELSGPDHAVIGVHAALRALSLSEIQLAVELLEEGRGVFWQQAMRLRANGNDLPPDVAAQLEDLSTALETESHGEVPRRKENQLAWYPEAALAERQRKTEAFDALVSSVRATPGFERFLRTPKYTSLRDAAALGPVVILLGDYGTTRAIIIDRDRPAPIHLHLHMPVTVRRRPDKPPGWIRVGWSTKSDGQTPRQKYLLQNASSVDETNAQPSRPSSDELHELLELLWIAVVNPVVAVLELPTTKGKARPRLFWLPTGPFTFFPFHAAGIYSQPDKPRCSHYFVSSYTPTLSALLHTRQDTAALRMPKADVRALLVAEPRAPGQTRLKHAAKEIAAVAAALPPDALLAQLAGATTVAAVVARLPDVSVLHLACHGRQDVHDALASAFLLGDGDLTLRALMRFELPRARLAFLSACETARGHPGLVDHAIHLAAALLFTGFKSVIATMWPMNDDVGPLIAKRIYRGLLKGEFLDLQDVPYVLDSAMEWLREEGSPAYEWATFVHIGA